MKTELLATVKPGMKVIITGWGEVDIPQAILNKGAWPVFCDISESTHAPDMEHLKELISNGCEIFISRLPGGLKGDTALSEELCRSAGLKVFSFEGGKDWREFKTPIYDERAFRYESPPEQYPYYMLHLNGIEMLCRALSAEQVEQ